MRTLLAAAALALAVNAAAGEIRDDFEGGANPDFWQWRTGPGTLMPDGGNPGGWLSSDEPFTNSLVFWSVPPAGSPLGQALAGGLVTSVAFDFQRLPISCDQPGPYQRFFLILTDSQGTPYHDDDDYAYVAGDSVPSQMGVWTHVAFEVPSDSPTLPPGWTGGHQGDPEHFRDGVTWADFIRRVDEIDVAGNDPFIAHTSGCYDAGVDSIVVGYASDAIFADGFDEAL